MDHSAAIMEDAGRTIEKAVADSNNTSSDPKPKDNDNTNDEGDRNRSSHDHGRKRKGNWNDASMRHGSRGGRGGKPSGDNKRNKKGDMGRSEYFRNDADKRAKTASAAQRRKDAGEAAPTYSQAFTQDEIAAEERRPKRKVAVMIGYAGTGYKGMQISPSEKTIEGEIFKALVAAGAISKANADDPKKAGLVRCARTDKGVHAAGNMISLKLIVEDEDIVEKINAQLPEQIRIWGIERTIGSFSCYQACDSRWYEYLIPSHAFLPPHPSSWLAKQLERLADEAGDKEGYEGRQEEVRDFWSKVDEEKVKPILETIDEDIRWEVVKALQGEEEAGAKAVKPDTDDADLDVKDEGEQGNEDVKPVKENGEEKTEEAAVVISDPALDGQTLPGADEKAETGEQAPTDSEANKSTTQADSTKPQPTPEEFERTTRIRAAAKKLRYAYNEAKRHYRISEKRIDRIQAALDNFVGTKNYHNYTIQKTFRDPSAKRNIKSFVINRTPILIGEAEKDEDKSQWLSMKVHGQSFMMHQIRKMIGMVTLLVRCGSDLKTMDDSFTESRYSIPKVPGLGLMLERPVFNSYNDLQATKHDRPKLEFTKWEKEIDAFKHKEIYARMFREELERGEFGRFFNHVDNFKEAWFLWLSSKGLEAAKGIVKEEEETAAKPEGNGEELE